MNVRITDASSSESECFFGTTTELAIDRAIYNRMQTVTMFPLGSKYEDTVEPLKTFISKFNAIQAGTIISGTPEYAANTFFGTLGVSNYYPHADNQYNGGLM